MRRLSVGAVAIAATLVFTSCASSYDDATRDGLREYVVAVSEASAAGDWPTALGALDGMAAEVDAARKAGKLDDDRFETITLAMEVVRQDLETAIAAAEDEAERQRLQEQQTMLEQQIAELRDQSAGVDDQPNDDDRGGNDKDKDKDKEEGDEKGVGKEDE